MSRIAPRTLAQMQHQPTTYEVVVRHNNGAHIIRLGFSQNKTKRALLNVARENGSALLKLLGDWDGEATYSVKRGWQFGPIHICFSGVTERALAAEQIVSNP